MLKREFKELIYSNKQSGCKLATVKLLRDVCVDNLKRAVEICEDFNLIEDKKLAFDSIWKKLTKEEKQSLKKI